MPEFAKGLKLAVTDRDEFEEFHKENAHDPAVQMESWGANSVPKALYIIEYKFDDGFYRCVNHHVNDATTNGYWNRELLEDMIDAGILEKDGYDVDFVETHA